MLLPSDFWTDENRSVRLQLVNLAENVTLCRHVVCYAYRKYVLSPVFKRSSQYADTLASQSTPMTTKFVKSIATICAMLVLKFSNAYTRAHVHNYLQICKYPDKVKRRKQALSSEDWVLSQIGSLQKRVLSGEDEEQDDLSGAPMDVDGLNWGNDSYEDDYAYMQVIYLF